MPFIKPENIEPQEESPADTMMNKSRRAVFMLLAVVFQSVTPFTPATVWSQIHIGLVGVVLQAAAVPFIVMGLKSALDSNKRGR